MNPHFLNRADLEQLPDGRNWRVTEAFGFWSAFTGLITVPVNFKTDLASIPQLFWNILPPFGKYTDAAILHDFLYRTQILPRATADRVLLVAMKVSRVKFWQRLIIYWNVRWFGHIAWNDDSRRIPKPPVGGHFSMR
jgi:hypothetical protein